MRAGVSDEVRINITEAGKIDSSRILFQAHLVFMLVHKLISYVNFTTIFTTIMRYPNASVIIKFGKAS